MPIETRVLAAQREARAATSIAGLSRKLPASCCEASSERTSRSSASSPAQACRRNAVALLGRTLQRRLQQVIDLFPSFGIHRSVPAGQFAIEPRLGGAPIAHHGDGRYFEHFGRLLHAESAKEAHFDDLHFARIEPRQRVHRVIQRYQVRGPVAAHHGCLFQGDVLHAASAFQVVAPRMFHQNAPHQLGRNREEMGAILPLHALIIHQAHVGFIHQGRRLQAVAGALASHVAARQAVELVINDGGQPFERVPVAVAPGAEERADLTHPRLTRLLHRE